MSSLVCEVITDEEITTLSVSRNSSAFTFIEEETIEEEDEGELMKAVHAETSMIMTGLVFDGFNEKDTDTTNECDEEEDDRDRDFSDSCNLACLEFGRLIQYLVPGTVPRRQVLLRTERV